MDSLPKEHLSAVLLSGSVARGDFFPGEFGGMVDFTVFSRSDDPVTAESVFGRDQAPYLPDHSVEEAGTWYQIWFAKPLVREAFRSLPEARMYPLLVSELLRQHRDSYTRLFSHVDEKRRHDVSESMKQKMEYVTYLPSDYKVDRWKRRPEARQLHTNLNHAIVSAVSCLYHFNGKYAPEDDRLFYYSSTLQTRPAGYVRLLDRLMSQRFDSIVRLSAARTPLQTPFRLIHQELRDRITDWVSSRSAKRPVRRTSPEQVCRFETLKSRSARSRNVK